MRRASDGVWQPKTEAAFTGAGGRAHKLELLFYSLQARLGTLREQVCLL